MKTLFLNPPFKTEHGSFSRTSRSPAITKSGTIYYPIWLCYAAGSVEASGHEIKIIDSCAHRYSLNKTIELIRDFSPQMAVIDTSTPSIYDDIKTGEEIKKVLPNCFVVLMGTHPTALPEETLNHSRAIDAIAIREADYTLKELANKLSEADQDKICSDYTYRDNLLSCVDGLVYRVDKSIRINKTRDFINNLDELPFISKVYKRHLDTKQYFFAASDYPEIQIMTARGCIAQCTFCVYPQTIHGLKYRTRTPMNIADEFQWIKENMPEIREIGIEDDTFTGNQNRVVEFCKEIIKRNIKIKWYCNVRVDLKYETMQWMVKAGCVLVTVGYESANKGILENINKRVTPEMILTFSRNTRKAGLLVHGCFMAGNKGETRDTLNESLRLALKLMDDTMQFFPLMVYPGTKDYEWAKTNGLFTIKDYPEYLTEDGCHNSVLKMPDMNSDEIRRWCNFARRQYYLRSKYIAYKIIQQITHPSEIRRNFKAAKRFIRFLIPEI
ncbi:MAG: cobalamin-dependent protein [Nitrospirae bacterium]|nr:cobalamin-dependent protein [Nitrospirota bacterium]